jgi:hypothetical protein
MPLKSASKDAEAEERTRKPDRRRRSRRAPNIRFAVTTRLRSQLHENKQGVDSKADVAKALEAFKKNFEIECPSDRPIFFKSRELYTEVFVPTTAR